MKMTDVIEGLRSLNPRMQEAMEALAKAALPAKEYAEDYDRCTTRAGHDLMARHAVEAASRVLSGVSAMSELVDELDGIVSGYTRVLGPKRDARQPSLPGFEEPSQQDLPGLGGGAE